MLNWKDDVNRILWKNHEFVNGRFVRWFAPGDIDTSHLKDQLRECSTLREINELIDGYVEEMEDVGFTKSIEELFDEVLPLLENSGKYRPISDFMFIVYEYISEIVDWKFDHEKARKDFISAN